MIISPFDFTQITEDSLIKAGTIIPSIGQKVWQASIFPNTTEVESTNSQRYEKDRIITKIDPSFFDGFHILTKTDSLKPTKNGKIWIKTEEFGDYQNSVKRYTQLDRPIDWVKETASSFINLSKPDNIEINDVILKPEEFVLQPSIIDSVPRKKKDFFQSEEHFNHPFITPRPITGTFKINSLEYISQIFKWAKNQGIKSIYCINELRPFIISDNWTTNLVYYTIIGSKR